jgi:lysylphosphatidylglycerol synthetase-like protein (DUF2156 family)
MGEQTNRGKLIIWQVLFILFSASWLMAPGLNRQLSYKTSLISHYETAGQPYAWLFRLCDVAGGLLLAAFAAWRWRQGKKGLAVVLLAVSAAGLFTDPVFTSTCQMAGNICYQSNGLKISLHSVESVTSFLALLALAFYDARRRHKLVSVVFVIFQAVFGALFISELVSKADFNTAIQMAYQGAVVIWLAWFCRDYFYANEVPKLESRTQVIRYTAGIWTFLNGLLAILISLAHLHLFGRIRGLYFAGNNAWLAQHGIVVGIIMLYLSRHLLRGERRARQILLAITAVETLKYSAITPNGPLLILYGLTFCLLFVSIDDFQRGVIPMTWRVRLKDLAYLVGALLLASGLALAALDRDSRVSRIAANSFDNFSDYALHADQIRVTHRESVLLANTITTFGTASLAAVLWVLFRPYKQSAGTVDTDRVRRLLERYSSSSEDYFKIWPADKRYFYGPDGFVAYKISGSIAFALADPVSAPGTQSRLLEEFVDWSRRQRLTACFLPVPSASLPLYEGLDKLQIGAGALIGTAKFADVTSKDKWWRWKRNRAEKEGYVYGISRPPHSRPLMSELKSVSDAWLGQDHQERGFALGYFDADYLEQCLIYYLRDESGRLAAFANRLPNFKTSPITTIDLMRHRPESRDAMPYLLSKAIETARNEGADLFDMGYVPFAGSKGPIQAIARTLSAGRFSAKGLEQFKNKFDPQWQDYYLVYDGDLADLAAIALNVEKAMSAKVHS